MSTPGHAPSSTPAWLVHLRLGRVSNLPTVWTDTLAGIFLVGVTPQPGAAAWLMLALSLFYTGGMYLNDAFDQAYDKQHHPTRPIPSGRVTADEVFALGFVQLFLGESVLAVPFWIAGVRPSWLAMTGGVVLGLLIVYYNYNHKKNPFSPLLMALCRALVYGVAAVAAADLMGRMRWSTPLGWGMAVLVCYLIGLTYVAK
ncbi:MAG TPA: UbiA family prenyltransferase, partial [bacterium]|nr:UbiA family prenyltransferase [bacterium]